MKTIAKLLAAGAALVFAAPASAADFLTLTFSGTGTQTIVQGAGFTQQAANGTMQYILPLNEIGGSGSITPFRYSYISRLIPGGGTNAVVVNGSVVLSEDGFLVAGQRSTLNAGLCFTGGVTAFTDTLTTPSQGCGFSWDVVSAPVRTMFAGTLTSLIVTEGFGRAPTTGFVSYGATAITAAVPEPATWAMMLLGFAMVGAATRYRRKVSVSFA